MTPRISHWPALLLEAIDKRRGLRHGLFWLAWDGFFIWVFVHNHMVPTVGLALRETLLSLPVQLGVAYSLLGWVLPLLWQPEVRVGRLLGRLAVWLGLSLLVHFAYRFFIVIPLHAHEVNPFPDYHVVVSSGSHFPFLASAGVAACLHVYRHWWRKEQDNARLAQENYRAELQLLKAQIHPHFLFNTLNNLYALTLKQSDQAPEVVARLTGLLRFVVEQGDAPLVALTDEVALLRDYLALEQLRYGARLTLDFDAGAMPAMGRIAPLLLLPLVENAFKHGAAEQLGRAGIRIVLAVAGTEFTCVITNTKNPGPATGHQGIGLRNVRQRLALLYPQRHRFELSDDEDTFTVRLALQLPGPAATPPPAPADFSQRPGPRPMAAQHTPRAAAPAPPC